jgi:hypothetical protein
LVFGVVGIGTAIVELLALVPELTIASVQISPTGYGRHNGYDKIVIQENVGTKMKTWRGIQ